MTRKEQAEQTWAVAATSQPLSSRSRWGIRVLATAAMAISGYLLWGSLTGDRLPGCGPDSGCDAVLNSRWAYWFGVPVSLAALAAYAAVIGMTVPLSRESPVPVRHACWTGLLAVALTVLGSAAWFVALQAFVIRAVCPYCMTAHACGAAMAILIVLARRSSRTISGERAAPEQSPATHVSLRFPAFGAAAALAILIASQVLHRPPTFAVQPMNTVVRSTAEQPAGDQQTTLGRDGAGDATSGRSDGAPRQPAGPFMELHAGQFRLDLSELPLVGRPETAHVIISLFDYTCSHCRVAHKLLSEVYRALSNQVAIVSLPVPLDGACNPVVKRPIPEHTNACTYARLGLAVWRADRKQMEAFDEWFFASPRPPSTNAAWEYASRLVGTNALAKALGDPWIDASIRNNARLYHTNYLRYAKGRLPQLILGTNLVAGSFHSTPVLLNLVRREFGLPVP